MAVFGNLRYGTDVYVTVDGVRILSDRLVHFVFVCTGDEDHYYYWPSDDCTLELPFNWQPVSCEIF